MVHFGKLLSSNLTAYYKQSNSKVLSNEFYDWTIPQINSNQCLIKIEEDTAIGDFPKWDSMGQIIIISALEKEFDIKFDPEVIMDLEDVGDMIEAVEERIPQ